MNTNPTSSRVEFARRVCIAVGIALFFGLVTWLLGASFNVLLLLLCAILIALPLRAAARWLSQKTGWREGIALIVVGLTLLGTLAGVGALVAPLIGEQTQQLQQELPGVLKNAQQQIEKTSWGKQLIGQIPESPEKLLKGGGGSQLAGRVFGAVSGTVSVFTDLYVIFFLALFLAAEPRLYTDGLVNLIPPAGRQRTRHILAQLDESLLGWLIGTLISMAIVGLLSWLGLSLLGVRLAGILALFAALITFIPNLGPVLALIPALLFALLDGPQQALNVLLLYVGIQFVESNLVTPLIQKRLNDIPPALLLLVQIIVGAFAGTLGLIMAAPLLAILMVLVRTIYQEDMLGDSSGD
ncbi:AI-2E family transporter [Spirosoma sordidisoli]|uniref:AI-2E family transporter n=1 Tax=Spirosoma sordidisoli TaxID=2502893 RepID=A0A4Q2UMY6_9BACT|nr:AI-2E family transporter [Spirosoma sordidisoli]RYC68129.1 AI-2E family transporter [Spirosoma sordidisoli]